MSDTLLHGCYVGALLCDVGNLQHVFDALRLHGLARAKAVRPYEGRKAVHLTVEGAALLCTGQAPKEVQELLDAGYADFKAGLRMGAHPYRGLAKAPLRNKDVTSNFTFIELFAGVGGFHRALEPLGGHCAFASEVDVDCQEAYALNFGSSELFGDITEVETSEFPKHDLLTAGFPCQPFSRRGERQGFEDPRGQLFHEIPRVLSACRPAGFVLENVWNLQYLGDGHWDENEDQCIFGRVFKQVVKCLEDVGYVTQTKTLSAQGWVPQKRQRVYLVGFRNDLAEKALQKFEWPTPPGGGVVRDILEQASNAEVRDCELTDAQWVAVQKSSTWQSGGERLRFVDIDGVASTLTGSYMSSFASTAEMVGPLATGFERPRFFTRRECARLMGFPEEHVLGNERGPNRAYRQLGNAVCPPLVQAVARNLLMSLGFIGSEDSTQYAAKRKVISTDTHDDRDSGSTITSKVARCNS